jgi:hypothetical protein
MNMGTVSMNATGDTLNSDRRRITLIGLWLFVAYFSFYALWTGGHTYSSDEEGTLLTLTAILHGSHAIDFTPEYEGIVPTRTGREGKPVTPSGLGQSLVAIPFYFVGKLLSFGVSDNYREVVIRLFVLLTNSAITAGIVVVLFFAALELRTTVASALMLSSSYALGTTAWPHAKTLFSEPSAAFFTILAVLLAIRCRKRNSLAYAVACGLAAGASLHVRISTAIFPALIFLYLVSTIGLAKGLIRAIRVGVAYSVGGILMLVLLAASNYWRFGHIADLGYQNVALGYPIRDGLYGLFLSSGKSILLYAPLTIVAAAGFVRSVKIRPAETLLAASIFMANALIFAKFPYWHGDHAWGPRYLNIALPCVVVVLAPSTRLRRWRNLVRSAAIVGLIPGLLGSVVYFNTYFYVGHNTIGADLINNQPKYWRYFHFDPNWSPLLGHARLAGEAVIGAIKRFDGSDPSIRAFPAKANDRYHWYFWPPQLDTWWAWFPMMQGPKYYLLLVPLLVIALVAAGLNLRRLTNRVSVS